MLNVMIAEDEALIALDLEIQVRDAGHRVVAIAPNADAAVALAHETRPHLALMDMRLANGSSGADAAKGIYEGWGIRCIFISGNLDPDTRTHLAQFRPFAMLSKPILPSQLVTALRDAEADLSETP